MEEPPYKEGEDYELHGNVLVLKYSKLDFNKHKYGSEKGFAPLMQECRQKGIDTILINLENTLFIESHTLGSIVEFKKEANKIELNNINLYNVTEEVTDLLKTTGIDQLFGNPYNSLEEALQDLKK